MDTLNDAGVLAEDPALGTIMVAYRDRELAAAAVTAEQRILAKRRTDDSTQSRRATRCLLRRLSDNLAR